MNTSTAAYIVFENQLLLLLRDNIPTIKDPNKWDTPGGSCEGEESFEDCLLRELDEELELKLEKSRLKFLWETTTPTGNTERSFLIVLHKEEKAALVLHEGQTLRFFTFQDLATLEFTKHLTNVFTEKKDLIAELLLVAS